MPFLPLFLDLSRGAVILVGAGALAEAKLAVLRARGADVRWYPMSDDASGNPPAGNGKLEVVKGELGEGDFAGAVAVVLASGGEFDERLARVANEHHLPVNVVDRPELSTFIFPAIVDRGDVVIAISTGGTAPVLARRLRERIETIIPENIGALAAFIGRWRQQLRARFGAGWNTRQFWERFVDSNMGRDVLEGRSVEAETWMNALSAQDVRSHKIEIGAVALVGAGPGDPDLLTLKALHALQDADIVLYDELVSSETLDRVRRDAAKIYVGKRKGKPGESVDAINQRMIAAAKAGARVVRLKGGDPFIFGRGGEELEALREAGIPVSIVPGITAALGCAAEAQIPLTYRREATRLVLLTGHRADEADAIDWSGLTAPETTLAIYMGHSSAAAIRDGLIAAGRDPNTPAAVIARGTRADSQTVTGALKDLPSLAEQTGDGPALLVIGSVVAHGEDWNRQALEERLASVELA